MISAVSNLNLSRRWCSCGSGGTYAACCGAFHSGDAVPVSAKQLMRSRFSAFCVGHNDYLLATWHPRTRPTLLETNRAVMWRSLDIVRTEGGGLLDNVGVVQFVAHYEHDGAEGAQHEVSQFEKIGRRWFYLAAAPA